MENKQKELIVARYFTERELKILSAINFLRYEIKDMSESPYWKDNFEIGKKILQETSIDRILEEKNCITCRWWRVPPCRCARCINRDFWESKDDLKENENDAH